MDFLDPDAREHLRSGRARSPRRRAARPLRPRDGPGGIQTAPVRVHAARPEPGPDLRHGGRLDRVRVRRDAAECQRPGPRSPYRQPRGLSGPHAGSQSLNVIHFFAGYPVEPIDIHPWSAICTRSTTLLTLTDKAIHCYSLGRQRNLDVLEMVRIARGIDEATLDASRRSSRSSTPSSPLRLDTPMSQGIIDFASATRSCA